MAKMSFPMASTARGHVSYPSTLPKHRVISSSDNDIRDNDPSLAYDGYPFIEWEDVDDDQRRRWAGDKFADAMIKTGVRDTIRQKYLSDLHATVVAAYDIEEARQRVQQCIQLAKEQEVDARKAKDEPVTPAAPHHLMAEGMMLKKALDHVTGKRPWIPRKVAFSEPVNRFTCLKGDRLAVGGDMLTSVTVTHTQPEKINRDGKTVVIHVAEAINT